MAATDRYPRKKLLINPRLQSRLMRDCCTVPLAALIGCAILLSLLVHMVAAEAHRLAIVLPSLDDLPAALIGLVVICGAVILYHGLQLSHRVAGPMYRLSVSIDQLLAGNTSFSVSLREHDYLHETARRFNDLVEHLHERELENERLRDILRELGVAAVLPCGPGHAPRPDAGAGAPSAASRLTAPTREPLGVSRTAADTDPL